jgi:hypothetical protein
MCLNAMSPHFIFKVNYDYRFMINVNIGYDAKGKFSQNIFSSYECKASLCEFHIHWVKCNTQVDT